MRIPAILGFVAVACASNPPPPAETHGEQSFRDAIELMCEVDRRANIAPDADVLERGRIRSDYIIEHVKNPDAIYFRTLWSVKDSRDKAKELGQNAQEAGLEHCTLADALSREAL